MRIILDKEMVRGGVSVECATRGHGRCRNADCACWCHPPVICRDADYHSAGYRCATCGAGVSIGIVARFAE